MEIMSGSDKFCCGCLSSRRTLKLLTNFWKMQCFQQILNEVPVSHNDGSPVSLCFECEAILSRFIKFKQQVKYSFTTLNEYIEQKKDLLNLKQLSNLRNDKINLIDFLPDQEIDTNEHIENISLDAVIKTEDEDCWQCVESSKIEIEEEKVLGNSDENCDGDDRLASDSDNDYVPEEDIKKKKRPKTVLSTDDRYVNGKFKKKKQKKVSMTKSSEIYTLVILNDDEVAEERRILARNAVYENSNIKCEKCITSFPNSDDLKDHIANKHDSKKSNYKCAICECTFSNEVSYNYHSGKHVKRYQCTVCLERLPSVRSVSKHYHIYHQIVDSYHGCTVCGDNFMSEKDLMNHKLSHKEDTNSCATTKSEVTDVESTNKLLYMCEYCDKSFKWKTSLNKHSEMHRIEIGLKRKPYCEPCRLTFTTTSNLQKHVKTSSKHQIQLKLRAMAPGSKLKESLEQNEQNEQNDQNGRQAREEAIRRDVNSALTKYACAHCDKSFQWKGNLLRHVASHEARARGGLACAPCGRSFASLATYTQHMRRSRKHVSEDDFKYICSDCGKKFVNRTLLKEHVDWEHLKNFVHKCPVCEKVFKSHTSLYLHKKVVHRQDGIEHLCDHCGKSFPNQAKLRTHIIAMHTSEQPYRCSLCTATFSWHSCLSRHVKVVHQKMKLRTKKRTKDREAGDE